ncbi:hypothetical protein KAU11_02330 [Candidatus Babeliales bacterium]|nr:hypothetical protein [Candidatus Babeliales bacterium]
MKKLLILLATIFTTTCFGSTINTCNPILFTRYEKYENADLLIRKATAHRGFILAPLLTGILAATAGYFVKKKWPEIDKNMQVPLDITAGMSTGLLTLVYLGIKRHFTRKKCIARIKRMLYSNDLDALYKFFPPSVVGKMQQIDHEHEVSEREIFNLLEALKDDVDGFFAQSSKSFSDQLWALFKTGKWKKQWQCKKGCTCNSCSITPSPTTVRRHTENIVKTAKNLGGELLTRASSIVHEYGGTRRR